MSNQFELYAVTLGSTHMKVKDASYDPRLEPILDGTAGIDNTVAANRGTKPLVTFKSAALGTAIGAVPSVKLAVSTSNPIVLYFARCAGPALSAAADCVSLTANTGVLAITGITGNKDGAAELSFEFAARYDGTNLPFIVALNATLPALTALGELYTLYAAVLSYGVSSTLQLKLADANLDMGIDFIQDRCAADIHPTFTAIKEQKSIATLKSNDVGTILAVTGLRGLAATSLVLYFAKLDGPALASGSVHVSVTLNKPLVRLDAIDPTHNEPTTLTLVALPIAETGVDAVALSAAAALPAATHLEEMFTLGPAVIDSVTYEALSWNIAGNHQTEHEGHSGNVQPTYADILKSDPEIRVSAINVTALPWYGKSITAGDFYLRKIAADGSRVADETEEHIKFSIHAALAVQGQVSGQWAAKAQNTVSLKPVKSGANDTITVTIGAALP